jgi:adenylate cyclase
MIKSLQQRLILFLLLPVALLMLSIGFLGFIYARQALFTEWKEASTLKLERAAHYLDMRLAKSEDWIKLFEKTGEMNDAYSIQSFILNQLKSMEGIDEVNLKMSESFPQPGMNMMGQGMVSGRGNRMMMHFHKAIISEVTPPQYDIHLGHKTVRFISKFKDEDQNSIGSIEVVIRFDYLLEGIRNLGWWQSELAGLVDKTGRFIAYTETKIKTHKQLGETKDPLELSILAAMQKRSFGTMAGPGHPPEWVGGFYKLKNAPWAIVLFAPGTKILAPIISFRTLYLVVGGAGIIFILLLIRFVGGRMVRSVRQISETAEKVAHGNYGDPLPVKSKDEIGQLTESFNAMVTGLKQRDFISNTFGRYVDQEIARELMQRPEALRLGGQKREVAILMSDLRGFTPLSETLNPDIIIRMLNRYFSRMIETIQKHKGIIVDFCGDALLVFFDPMEGPILPSTYKSIQCAVEMQQVIEIFNAENRVENLPELQMGIGINVGEVVVGNIGSETRAKYGIVGSAVNITHRIQSSARRGEVVISDSVYGLASAHLTIKKFFEERLKGIHEPVSLYVVEGFQDKTSTM